ncbi:MAG: hypothetical protein EA370_03380 [Wenzhouxiangella sp.]|nr:MAG: hypothetical protein EA370_03380 [Wenzhouxiangella sp.]
MSNKQHDKIRSIREAEPGDAFAVPAEHLERVIARASILQHAAGEGEQRQLSENEILAIGREVGLEPEHVRRALAEFRAESLSPPMPEDHPQLTRFFGSPHARVRRVMRGDPQDIHRAFERHLRAEERMRAVRLRGTSSVWEPDSSWMSKLTRALDLEGRGFELTQLKSFSIVTAPASPDESLVTLTADLGEARSEQIQGWGFGLLAALVAVFVLPITGAVSGWVWLLIPTLAAGGTVAGIFAIQRAMESRRRRAALLLEGLMDQLEFGRR